VQSSGRQSYLYCSEASRTSTISPMSPRPELRRWLASTVRLLTPRCEGARGRRRGSGSKQHRSFKLKSGASLGRDSHQNGPALDSVLVQCISSPTRTHARVATTRLVAKTARNGRLHLRGPEAASLMLGLSAPGAAGRTAEASAMRPMPCSPFLGAGKPRHARISHRTEPACVNWFTQWRLRHPTGSLRRAHGRS
jgi:hypothetical protein